MRPATAHSLRDGTVLLDVLVPGAGTLTTGASGAVDVSEARSARRGRHGRSKGHVAIRTVASRVSYPGEAGLLELKLKLASRYASLAGRRGGLAATALLSFSAPGHKLARASLGVSFVRVLKPTHRKAKHGSHGGARR